MLKKYTPFLVDALFLLALLSGQLLTLNLYPEQRKYITPVLLISAGALIIVFIISIIKAHKASKMPIKTITDSTKLN